MIRDIKIHDIKRALSKFGFYVVSDTGGHTKYGHRDGRTVPVPRNRVIKGTVVIDIIKQAKLVKKDFLEQL